MIIENKARRVTEWN